MVKGRYVCQVEVDFEYDFRNQKITFGEVRDRIMGEWVDKAIDFAVWEVFRGGDPKITVTKQYANITEGGSDDTN